MYIYMCVCVCVCVCKGYIVDIEYYLIIVQHFILYLHIK